jgi:hypothetical protein
MKGVVDMKISEMIFSAIIKKGILYEARNVNIDVDIPIANKEETDFIMVNFKAEHMTIRIDKE